jgi:ubiquinone/menaquinone biosynthesis C-methylase UbiE
MAARLVDGFRPARYIATDLDPHQLEAARQTLAKRYPGGLPPALELRVANMLDLPFPDASFDAVFAFVAIHHASPKHRDFANVPRALAEINRVLKPKGSLVYEEIEHKERIRRWLMERGTPSRRFSEDGNANRSSPRKSGRRRSRRTNEPTLSDEWTDSGLRFPGRSRKIPSSRHAGSTIRAF